MPSVVDNEAYKGYIVTMRVDPRDCLGGANQLGAFPFQARLLDKTTILVTAPALDHHDMGSDDALIDAMTDAATNHEDWVLTEAVANFSESFKQTKIENKMFYRLEFSGGVDLASEVLECHAGNLDGLLSMEGLPLSVPVPALHGGHEYTDTNVVDQAGNPHILRTIHKYFCGVLFWRVADTAMGTRRIRLEDAQTATAAATAMLRRVNING